jgi:hypothetical protein
MAMPATATEISLHLPDVDPVYLMDRGSWADFKRTLNECSLMWGLPDWMTTIMYHGVDWDAIAEDGTDLSQ